MSRAMEPDRWCVYRIHAPVTRELLYIGHTCKRKSRIKEHYHRSEWFPCEFWWELESSGLVEFEEHPNYWCAVLAEALAIDLENPKHNKERPAFAQLLAVLVANCKSERRRFDLASVRQVLDREGVA